MTPVSATRMSPSKVDNGTDTEITLGTGKMLSDFKLLRKISIE